MSAVHNTHEYVIRKRGLLSHCKCLLPNFSSARTRNHKGYPEIIYFVEQADQVVEKCGSVNILAQVLLLIELDEPEKGESRYQSIEFR